MPEQWSPARSPRTHDEQSPRQQDSHTPSKLDERPPSKQHSKLRLPESAPVIPCLCACTCTKKALVTTRGEWRKKIGVTGWVTRALATHAAQKTTKKMAAGLRGCNCPCACVKTLEDKLDKEAAWQGLLNREAYGQLLELSASQRHELFQQFRKACKDSMLEDPDMFSWVRKLYDRMIDASMDNIELELEKALGESFQVESRPTRERIKCEEEDDSCLQACIWRARAFLLYHFFPCDKSMFGRLKDPVYLIIYVLTLFPIAGLRVMVFSLLFILLIARWPPDQYQMVNFLLVFKGTTFMSQGFITMSFGCWKYYACYSWHRDNLVRCDAEHGPASAYGNWQTLFVDYIGTVFLTWASFAAWYKAAPLRGEERYGDHERMEEARFERMEKARLSLLRRMLVYDICCFVLSMQVLVVLNSSTWQSAVLANDLWQQIMTNIFWCKSVNALLSFPFSLYVIPLFQKIFTHTEPTGFDECGRLREFKFPELERETKNVFDDPIRDF